jgi:NADPH-dependent glutamate synthase beta subunit-like oxidoreductase
MVMPTPEPRWLDELAEVAFSDQPTTAINTGSWKSIAPRHEDKLPPCSELCPAGNDISKVLSLLAQSDLAGAAKLLRTTNPIPATLGRVCPHFCESHCNRDALGGSITVHMLERFLGDYSLADATSVELRPSSKSGKRVAVIGAGPAGISAAYALTMKGHEVQVFDDKPKPGGYLRTGIPDYRLPKSTLDREIALAERVGVKFRENTRVGRDITIESLQNEFHAVVVAVGLHKSRPLDVPGADHPNVYNGVELLERILAGEAPKLPRVVAVIGGGNTAIDVARSVLRLGVKPIVVYRRTEKEMPAIASEVEEAKKERIEFQFLAAPAQVMQNGNGDIIALECQKMKLGEPDSSGRRSPVAIPNEKFRIAVSGVISATGEVADLSFVRKENDKAGYFSAGDVATGQGTVAAAVGHGLQVAASVDCYLRTGNREPELPNLRSLWGRNVNVEKVATADLLNPAYFHTQPHPAITTIQPSLPLTTFDEIVQGFDLEQAQSEARRCFSCGTCNECLNCYYWCPDIAVHREPQNGGLTVDSMHCKGCGICVQECPRSAMSMGEVQP